MDDVPSLYVRVYRYNSDSYDDGQCSLIICEGISLVNEYETRTEAFPHYM